MIWVVLLTLVAVLAIGWGIKHWVDHYHTDWHRITTKEYWLTAAVLSFVAVPLMAWIGYKLAVDDRVRFVEYQNGWESRAEWVRTTCHRDGWCAWDYRCDPYIVLVTYRCGKSTCTRPETRYHECPYVKEEWSFRVHTTVGSHWIDEHRLPTNPDAQRWRQGVPVPRGVIEQAGVGIPERWAQVRARIDSGRPGPATSVVSYENYVLPANRTILHTAATNWRAMQAMIPTIPTGLTDYYLAEKVKALGSVPHLERWKARLHYLNAALGDRRGDVFLVLVRDTIAGFNPDAYMLALHAGWEDLTNERHALPANAITVAVGHRDGLVRWVRAFSGFPLGNKTTIAEIERSFAGRPFDPDSVIGAVWVAKDTVRYRGGLAAILLGRPGYEPPQMLAMAYLKSEIRPTGSSLVVLCLVLILIGSLGWGVPLLVQTQDEHQRAHRFRRYY